MRGFTLIEVLIYLSLFSILIGGLGTAAAAIQITAEKNAVETVLLEEGLFILGTFSQAARDGTLTQYYLEGTTLVRDFEGTTEALSSNEVQVDDFSYVSGNATGTEPEYGDLSLTLQATTSRGVALQHVFSARLYPASP